ncbi:hypothetical protein SEUCBS139899_008907 [Sporothrix eucalyptigena]
MDAAHSIAGLVSLGIQVTQALDDCYTDYKDSNDNVASTMKKLDHFLSMIKSLRAYIDGRAFKDGDKDLFITIYYEEEIAELK